MRDETARARVLEAADRLIYARGVRAVGIDQIRDASGVSLKRIYRLFGTKENIAADALRLRSRDFTEALTSSISAQATPREQLLGVFDFLSSWFEEPDFGGCPFVNAFAEAGELGRVTEVVEAQKHAFASVLHELVAALPGPPQLAEQLFLLAHGAMVVAAIRRTPTPARDARQAAELLIAAQT